MVRAVAPGDETRPWPYAIASGGRGSSNLGRHCTGRPAFCLCDAEITQSGNFWRQALACAGQAVVLRTEWRCGEPMASFATALSRRPKPRRMSTAGSRRRLPTAPMRCSAPDGRAIAGRGGKRRGCVGNDAQTCAGTQLGPNAPGRPDPSMPVRHLDGDVTREYKDVFDLRLSTRICCRLTHSSLTRSKAPTGAPIAISEAAEDRPDGAPPREPDRGNDRT
ncbi:hypothetical protein ACVILK_000262 [Bradyrhizobium embrapense]